MHLCTTWEDRVNFQCAHNSQLSDYGHSTNNDQGIWFDGMLKEFKKAYGKPSELDDLVWQQELISP
jgi:hypothetical protein